MYKKLVLSATSLLSVVALGVGATYALFTSNTATLSANTLTTGLAEIRICKELAPGAWDTTASGFTVTAMVPGSESELTSGSEVYLGNDDGTLNTELPEGVCNQYTGTPGSSDIDLQMVPKISNLSCEDASLENDMELRFVVNGQDSGSFSLTAWTTNTNPFGGTFAPGDAHQVQVFTKLSNGATVQNKSCTFNIDFQGSQVI